MIYQVITGSGSQHQHSQFILFFVFLYKKELDLKMLFKKTCNMSSVVERLQLEIRNPILNLYTLCV